MHKRILYIDDEPDQIFTLKHLFDDYPDLELIGASNAKECFETLENKPLPDLIFLDIMMKDMPGWELFDKIKNNQSWAEIPIVFLTARTDKLAKDAGNFLGDDFIEKPFEIDRIIAVVDKFTNKKDSNFENEKVTYDD